MRRDLAICIMLALATIAATGRVTQCDFLGYDDPFYVTQNPTVKNGLMTGGLVWAFHGTPTSNWHPVTWLSHMLDSELYGEWAGGHHLTNLLLHIANSILLYVVLMKMTGAAWRSGFVAALFALHPLHVESVAWVSERKDVLSALFWMLTILAYLRWLEVRTRGRYAAALSLFAVGLMAKPMLVTLPFALLLLDFWPLRRLSEGRRLITEKAPFFALSAVSSAVTVLVQRAGGAMASLVEVPFPLRFMNALVATVRYVSKTVWPAGLAVFYPMPDAIPLWQAAGAAALLAGASWLAVRAARRRPYAFVGWFWYLGTLVPVIGLVQVGQQSLADRYTYLPLIGLFVIVAWGGAELAERLKVPRIAPAVAAVMVVAALGILTSFQVRHWKDNRALFGHAVEVNPGNWLAHLNLSAMDAAEGRRDQALAHGLAALRANPASADVHQAVGVALFDLGRMEEAEMHFREALRLNPLLAEAHYNYGNLLSAQGRVEEAKARYEEAIRLKPQLDEAHVNLGVLLAGLGRLDEAGAHYAQALEKAPGSADAHYNLGNLMLRRGRADAALVAYQAALKMKPGFAEARDNLGTALFTLGRTDEAIAQFNEALRLRPAFPKALNNLGTALASGGKFEEAAARYRQALEIQHGYTEARVNLANALLSMGRLDEAIREYAEVLRAEPDHAAARANMNVALSRKGERPRTTGTR